MDPSGTKREYVKVKINELQTKRTGILDWYRCINEFKKV
jgi:hypothetical protein